MSVENNLRGFTACRRYATYKEKIHILELQKGFLELQKGFLELQKGFLELQKRLLELQKGFLELQKRKNNDSYGLLILPATASRDILHVEKYTQNRRN
jgi:hypothetical protein